MNAIPHAVLLIGAAVLTFVVLLFASALLSRLFVARGIRKLVATIGKEQLMQFTSSMAAPLPQPVQRYLHFALKEGQPNIRYARLKQRARFRHGENRPWFDVRATEYISGMEPAFVWDAILQHNAFWWRTAKLSFQSGTGSGHIKLFGAITLQELGGPETDVSMLFRFLSELVWLPTALLPTKTLRWEAIDDTTARGIITDGTTTVQADFYIDDIGRIDSIVTNSKYRDFKSGFEQHKFTLKCRRYTECEGVMIPMEVDFIWNMPSGDYTYGQFMLDDVRYFYA